MATKKNELHVDEILGSYETKNKDAKATKQSTNDWADEDEDNYAFSIAKEQQAAAKKAQKKKNTGKGWGDVEAAQQAQPKAQDFSKIQEDEQKKKIIKKPGQARQTSGVEIGSEAFPSLGEAPTKPAPKKNPEPTPAPVQQTKDDGFTTVGPKRFMNTKKKETGESFAPLEPVVAEKPIPVAPVREKPATTATTTTTTTTAPVSEPAQTRAPGIFQRKAADEPVEVPTDSKFKFGGEGPRKFVTGSKISFKREEQKDDHEALRLQREREIEEKILREKEELAKQRENREVRKHTKEGAPGEARDGPDEKRIAKFSNPKKEVEKQNPPQPEKVEEPESTESKHPKETVEMHGTLSNKGWGDGPLIKKSQKK